MDESTVIAKLREYEPELKAAGIMRLALFGSVALRHQYERIELSVIWKTVEADLRRSKPPYSVR